MAELRRPFLIAAFVLSVLVVLIEVGTALPTILSNFIHIGSPPGLGIPYLVLVDGVLAYTLGLMVVSLVVPERVIGRLQGCVTLIVSILGATNMWSDAKHLLEYGFDNFDALKSASQTSSAALNGKLPANTDSRSKSSWAGFSSRS